MYTIRCPSLLVKVVRCYGFFHYYHHYHASSCLFFARFAWGASENLFGLCGWTRTPRLPSKSPSKKWPVDGTWEARRVSEEENGLFIYVLIIISNTQLHQSAESWTYVCFLQTNTETNAGTAEADIRSHKPPYKHKLHTSYTCLHRTPCHYSSGSNLIAEAKCVMEILSLINIPIIF